ncbi:hypothetical protein [Nocardiopsis sp. ATB16-24]|uniref:hypothetical protein n=1 Tax=Nocardiopsis sp. ATB16-24 TaxID=3019555 RepID=UPI0025576DAF|nr:hypothetical protein [Nocardiopsis sp. ATB16-24]
MSKDTPIQHGHVTATYFWDDGSGINGDTGMPAGGEPMQKGLFSSPSWPLGTEGYIVYEEHEVDFFIGDRGPGAPSHDCDVLLDIDGKTFAEITGQTWDDTDYTVSGGNGHLQVDYYITKWGDGHGSEGAPHPFQQPENTCEDAVSPIPEEVLAQEKPGKAAPEGPVDGSGRDDTDQEEAGPGEGEKGGTAGGDGGGGGVTAESATNDLSASRLMGADGVPGGAGLLVLALVSVLLLALYSVWTRRPSGAHAGVASEGGRLLDRRSGRHGMDPRLKRTFGRPYVE